MIVTSEQISLIKEFVIQHRITLPTLQDDLIDHLCCVVEKKLENGKSFAQCFEEAVAELAPSGLNQIQKETDFLLNSTNLLNMKKLTYFLGLISTMAISFGWLLRILRMGELGNAVFAFGALGFVALFLPMLTVNYFRDNKSKPVADKVKFVSGAFSLIFIGLAFLAKIMHMPGADEVMWMGGILFTFGFLPFLFFTMYRKSIAQQGNNE